MEYNNETNEQTEFSGSLQTIDRISKNIVDAEEFLRLAFAKEKTIFKVNDCLYNGGRDNFNLWQKAILSNWLEVYPYLNKKEIEDAEKKFFPYVDNPIIQGCEINNEEYKKVKEFDLWLRVALKKHGLLMRSSKDPNLAIMR